jgi:hypothetical protein
MTRRLKANSDKVALWDGAAIGVDDDGPFNEPLSHLDRLVFHSDLDYIEVLQRYEGTFTAPAKVRGSVGQIVTPIFSHGLAEPPLATMRIDGVQISGLHAVLGDALDGLFYRILAISTDATNVNIHELYSAGKSFTGPGLAAQTFDIVINVLGVAAPTSDTIIDIGSTGATLGRGVIGPDRRFVKVSTMPSFFGARGRTIDSLGLGLRNARPDGTMQDFFNYAGSFMVDGVGLSE